MTSNLLMKHKSTQYVNSVLNSQHKHLALGKIDVCHGDTNAKYSPKYHQGLVIVVDIACTFYREGFCLVIYVMRYQVIGACVFKA